MPGHMELVAQKMLRCRRPRERIQERLWSGNLAGGGSRQVTEEDGAAGCTALAGAATWLELGLCRPI